MKKQIGFALALCLYMGTPASAQVVDDAALTDIVDRAGFTGVFLSEQLSTGAQRAGHAERAATALIPASTFKIFSAMAALEAGVIASEQAVIPWDGVVRSRTELNTDLTLTDAFRLSAVPHFQELVRRIGHVRMQHFIDAVGYGNRDISGGDDTFWLEGALRITPLQQIAFLKRLYRNELPFRVEVMEAVKRMMESERTAAHVVRSKTGLAILNGHHNVGWWVGWVEKGDDVTFFATALEADNPPDTFIPARIDIARKALTSMGVLTDAP